MRTKLILLAAILAAIVYSCSSERDDTGTPITPNVELKQLKTNINQKGTARTGDSIVAQPMKAPTDPIDLIDPVDGGDPKNLPPRK